MKNFKFKKFSISRVISIFGIIILFFYWIMMLGGEVFFSWPAFVFTFGTTFLLLLGIFGKDFVKFIPDSILALFFNSERTNPKYVEICQYGSRFIISVAVIGTLISFIHMFRDLEDISTIGVGFATRLCPMLYALIFSEIVFVLLEKIYKGNSIEKKQEFLQIDASKNLDIILIGCGFVMIIWFSTVLAGMWDQKTCLFDGCSTESGIENFHCLTSITN